MLIRELWTSPDQTPQLQENASCRCWQNSITKVLVVVVVVAPEHHLAHVPDAPSSPPITNDMLHLSATPNEEAKNQGGTHLLPRILAQSNLYFHVVVTEPVLRSGWTLVVHTPAH